MPRPANLVDFALWLILAFVATTFMTACHRARYEFIDTLSVLTQPASLQQCPYGGIQVSVGKNISIVCNGAPGSDGANGSNGKNGHDGTKVIVVNLCPGYTSYPEVFLEVALCINNQLYAVYSIPNTFFTLIPPGIYTSNAIGSACNLVVKPNCVVSH